MERALSILLVALSLGLSSSPAYSQNADDQKIADFLKTLKSSVSPIDQQLSLEVERAQELEKAESFDALNAFKILPSIASDFLGFNGWQKSKSVGVSIPLESYFFNPLKNISTLDLVNAFGRTDNMAGISSVCTYLEPKKGTGTRPGFKVTCDGQKIKVKFREIHTQPLATRIFWALGYYADPADYHKGLKVKYDRKIFEEFNSRVGVPLKIRIFGKDIKVKQLNPHYDAIDFMISATLKDGTVIEPSVLAEKIADETDQDIDFVLTKPVQLQYAKIKGRTEVGPWSFGDFDHAQSRSLRAVGVLAAWLAIYDIRRDNNLLVLDEVDGKVTPKFMFPDLGSGLGGARYRISLMNKIENIKQFFPKIAKRGRIRGVTTNEKNEAFISATKEDFAYGVRLINQFSEDQLRELLSVSGYEGDELEQFYERLSSRRKSLNAVYIKD